MMLFEHIGKPRGALEAGLASDPLYWLRAKPQRVDRAGEAAIDQKSIRRPPGRRAKAANEMMFGNADKLREIAESDIAADIGVDVVEDPTQVSRRQGMWCSRRRHSASALVRHVRMPAHQMSYQQLHRLRQ